MAVIDDEPGVRRFYDYAVTGSGEFRSCGYFASGKEALGALTTKPRGAEVTPDIVLIGWRLPDGCGIRRAREVLALQPHLRIILMTSSPSVECLDHAAKAGITDCRSKPFTPDQCLATLRLISARLLAEARQAAAIAAPSNDPTVQQSNDSTIDLTAPNLLNRREDQVMEHLAKGLRYKEIPDQIASTLPMVKKWQHSAFVKLHALNGIDATDKWRRWRNMVQPPR